MIPFNNISIQSYIIFNKKKDSFCSKDKDGRQYINNYINLYDYEKGY
jgi:16S rRNA U516 pseudouridylate synthase RsuA-like enzyme